MAMIIAAGCAISFGSALEARAGGLFHKSIPRETLAMDYRTGGPMMAPPIPYGEYAKDYSGTVHGAIGHAAGLIHGLGNKVHGAAGSLHGAGNGMGGHFAGHGNDGSGEVYGDGSDGAMSHGHGGGLFHGGVGGLFGHKKQVAYAEAGNSYGGGDDHGHGMGLGHEHAGASAPGTAWVGAGSAPNLTPLVPVKASSQTVVASGQAPSSCGGCFGTGKVGNGGGCGICGGSGKIKSLFGKFCGKCKGDGCGGCGGTGLMRDGAGHSAIGQGQGCGNCHGKGCGMCGRGGIGSQVCGNCHGKGCGMCGRGGNGSQVCGNCHGKGCGMCAHLKNKAHGLLGLHKTLAAKLLHKGDIDYFVGPGGPVPITPGYVPYVVTTRSPRDFFAFPPFSDQVP